MKPLSRRSFITATATAGTVGMAALAEKTQPSVRTPRTTRYIAAYDTESPSCLKACEKIVEVPWSLHRFDPEMRMLERTFSHAQSQGLRPSTYAELVQAL